jgi:hypothetical protein
MCGFEDLKMPVLLLHFQIFKLTNLQIGTFSNLQIVQLTNLKNDA